MPEEHNADEPSETNGSIDPMNRRRFLRNATVAAGSMAAIPSVAAASSDERNQNGVSRETISSSETVTIRRIRTDEQVTLLRYNWKEDTVEYAKLGDPSGKQLSTTRGGNAIEISQRTYSEPEDVPLEAMSPSVQSTGLIVEDATGLNWYIGDCHSWYNNHRYGALGFRLKDDLANIWTAVGSAVLCDIIFRFAARKVSLLARILQSNKLAAAIDGVCGWLINQLIDSIDGAVFTLGAWDIDTGWADWPELALGASSGFGVGYWSLHKFSTLDGIHTQAF